MKKLNNKGFTLIEVLAVVVLMSILVAIMIPTVGSLIEKNKENNYEDLEKSIIQAAKIYMSDNRYDITVDGSCVNKSDLLNVVSVQSMSLINSKLPISVLINVGNIKTNKEGNIINPKNDSETLDIEDEDLENGIIDESVVTVKYDCSRKDYIYKIEVNDLKWVNKNN